MMQGFVFKIVGMMRNYQKSLTIFVGPSIINNINAMPATQIVILKPYNHLWRHHEQTGTHRYSSF
jgi:flagellar assembly factor FliW